MTDDKPEVATDGPISRICLGCRYEDALRTETARVEAEIERLRRESDAKEQYLEWRREFEAALATYGPLRPAPDTSWIEMTKPKPSRIRRAWHWWVTGWADFWGNFR